MASQLTISLTIIIISASVICRLNISRLRKNRHNFLSESKDNDINNLFNFLSKESEIKEYNQLNYLLLIIITLIVFFKNIY